MSRQIAVNSMLIGAMVLAACGPDSASVGSVLPPQESPVDQQLQLDVHSEAFQSIGAEIRGAQDAVSSGAMKVDGVEIDSSTFVDPVLTAPIDLRAPGVYRVEIALPLGTDPAALGVVVPNDLGDFITFDLSIEVDRSAPISEGNRATLVISVDRVDSTYDGFQAWVY